MSKNFGGRGRLLRAMACRKFLTCIACVERGKGKKEAGGYHGAMQQDPLYHDFFAVVRAVSHNIIQMIYSCF